MKRKVAYVMTGCFIFTALFAASAVVYEDGVVSEKLTIAEGETLTIHNPHSVNLAGGIAMTNATLVVDSSQDVMPETDSANIVTFSEDSSDEVLFAQNALLLCITNLTAEMAGTQVGASVISATLCNFSMGANTATCQFQVKPDKSSTIRSVNLTFTQKGNDIYFAAAKRYYKTDASLAVGDVIINKDNSSGDNSRKQVHLVNIKAYFSSFASFGSDTLIISGPTASTNGTMNVIGSISAPKTVVIEDKDALPINGRVEVFEYAQLNLNVPNLTGSYVLGGIDHGSDIYVHKNARLLVSKPYQLNANSSSVLVDGGTIAFTPDADNIDSNVYFYELTLKDGARMIGCDPRVRRRGGDAKLNIRGEKPSFCDTGIVLWAESADEPGALKIDVEDVSKDDAADFTINGSVRLTSNESYRNCTVYKTGAGTLRVNGRCDYINPTRIQGGTLLLGVNDAMHSGMPIMCEGGSLAVEGGTTNTLGSLKLVSSAAVRIGANAKLSFVDSSSESWDEKSLLTFEADLNGESVRFGENSSGLTEFQLRRVRCGGKRCYLDENGYLRQRNDGLHIHLK